MNFDLSPEQIELKSLTAKAAQQILAPIVEDDEKEGRFRTEIIEELGKLGLTGIPTPSEYGGVGLGYLEYAIAIEEIAAISPAYAVSIAVSGLPQIILNKFGSEEQKKKYIPPLAQGKHIGSFCLTESQSGSDAAALKTTATLQPERKQDVGATQYNDHYIINGTKLFITQANLASTLIVFARTAGGISALLVEKATPGLSIGKIEHKMGINISPTCEVVFENVKIPKSNLIGKEGDGFKIAMSALDSGRITIGATAVGLSRAAFEYSLNYAKNRKQFNKPILDFQAIQFMLADMYTLLESSRLLVHKAAFMKDQDKPFTQEASIAKLFSTDAAMKITTDAVQILGGYGYMKDYPVERYFREAKVLQIVEGTNQIQRMVIGRSFEKNDDSPWL